MIIAHLIHHNLMHAHWPPNLPKGIYSDPQRQPCKLYCYDLCSHNILTQNFEAVRSSFSSHPKLQFRLESSNNFQIAEQQILTLLGRTVYSSILALEYQILLGTSQQQWGKYKYDLYESCTQAT